MQRSTPLRVILMGCGLILCGLLLAYGTQNVSAGTPAPAVSSIVQQEAEPSVYEGSQYCSSCHKDLSRLHDNSRHAQALVDVSKTKSLIKADFSAGEKERTITFPGENAPRAFKAEDVAYVIGSGRYVQRFLYKVERDQYAVFPAEWNTAKKAWQPYNAGKTWPTDKSFDFTSNCAGCHTTGLDVKKAEWVDDGVQCEACHGPATQHLDLADKVGSKPSPEELVQLRAAIKASPDPQVCGACHSRGTDPESKLPFPVKYQPGKNLLDPAVYALVPPTSADHWWPSGHASQQNMQFNEWMKTKHATSLTDLQKVTDADPACLDCHSADAALVAKQIAEVKAGKRQGEEPKPLAVKDAKFGVSCTSCHNSHSDNKTASNLTQEPYALCVSCHRDTAATKGWHNPVQEMFEGKTVIKEVPGVPSIHFTDKGGPRCTTCHMSRIPVETFTLATHTWNPLKPGQIDIKLIKDSCTSCHDKSTPEELEKFISDNQRNTTSRLKAANAAIKENTPQWVKDAISFVERDGSFGIHNHRYTAALLSEAEKQLGLSVVPKAGLPADTPVSNPADCRECHQKQYDQWLSSPHGKASLNDKFRKAFADQKQPTFCMGCHASGYDDKTGKYVFEGIVCTNCHVAEKDNKHPPAAAKVVTDSAVCGTCHSGAHSPTYDEWLVSQHNRAKIDCVDCHTPHDNGLRQKNINDTCGNCHKDAMEDKVHMGEKMTCVDCHMKTERDAAGVFVVKTGHSMSIDPGTCASCHGKTHVLSKVNPPPGQSNPEQVAQLQSQITTLKDTAQANWASGIAGGAAGTLIVVALGLLLIRRGRLL